MAGKRGEQNPRKALLCLPAGGPVRTPAGNYGATTLVPSPRTREKPLCLGKGDKNAQLSEKGSPLPHCYTENLHASQETQIYGDFPGGAVVKPPRSQCRGPGLDLWSGN